MTYPLPALLTGRHRRTADQQQHRMHNHGVRRVAGPLQAWISVDLKFGKRIYDTMKPIVLLALLLSSYSASESNGAAAFAPTPRRPPPSSLTAHHGKRDCEQNEINEIQITPSISADTTRRTALQLLSSLPAILAPGATPAPANAETVLSVPAQTRETTWPLGKVAFSLLPLAGSYSRRATGE